MHPKTYREQLRELCRRYGGKPAYEIVASPTRDKPLWEVRIVYRCEHLTRTLAQASGRRKNEASERAADQALAYEIQSIRSLHGRVGNEKGKYAEQRVVRILTDPPDQLPKWIIGATHATPQQDSEKVDVVVHTSDMGDLFLQVKSSETAKRAFLTKYPNRLIEAVAVRPADSDSAVFRNVLYAIRMLRQRMRSQRRPA